MTTYSLNNMSHVVGKIGSLQAINVIPVVAGDSFEISYQQVLEMRAFQRGIVIDAQVDICAFFVPHRHIYGDIWMDFLKEGRDTSITLPERDTNGIPRFIPWLNRTTGLPAWLADGYFRIWSRYFRPPNQDIPEVLEMPTSLPAWERNWGYRCAHLPAIWNTGVANQPDDGQFQLDVSGGVLDTIDLADKRNEYAAALDREWHGNYYTDLLDVVWHGRAGTDADERPTLLWHSSQTTSGQNIYGTSEGNLGANAGRGHGIAQQRIPRKFFGEHGAIWFVQVVRFPAIHEHEVHYLSQEGRSSYGEFACDPRFISGQHPVLHESGDFFDSGAGEELFYQPYAQWYREQPNFIHWTIRGLNSYPYLDSPIRTRQDAALIRGADYDEIFSGGGQFHFDARTEFNVMVDRALPSTMETAYNGAPG